MESGFVPFAAPHLATLALTAAAALLLPLAVRHLTPRWARPVGIALALSLVAQELVQFGLLWQSHGPTTAMLPLHLCALAVWLTAWMLITAHARVFEVVYFWGLGGTTQALATPDLAAGFPSAHFLLFFLGHGLVVVGVAYGLIVYRLRPTAGSVVRAALITLGFAAAVVGINAALGTNFMYLMAKPAGPSLLDWLGPWPWYWLGLIGIGALTFALLYAPFFVADRITARRGQPG